MLWVGQTDNGNSDSVWRSGAHVPISMVVPCLVQESASVFLRPICDTHGYTTRLQI